MIQIFNFSLSFIEMDDLSNIDRSQRIFTSKDFIFLSTLNRKWYYDHWVHFTWSFDSDAYLQNIS